MNTTSTALTTAQQEEDLTGLQDYVSTLRPHPIVLLQSNHANQIQGAVVGAYYDKSANKTFVDDEQKPKPIVLIPLAVRSGKTYYDPEGERGKTPAVCRSTDGVTPILDNPNLIAQAKNCNDCVHNDWAAYYKSGKDIKKKPRCANKPQLLFLNKEDEMPYIITLPSMSITNFKRLKDSLKWEIVSQSNKNKKNPSYAPLKMFDFEVEMSSTKDINKYGQFRVVTFSSPKFVGEAGKYREFVEKYVYRPKAQAFSDPDLDDSLDDVAPRYREVPVNEEVAAGEIVDNEY